MRPEQEGRAASQEEGRGQQRAQKAGGQGKGERRQRCTRSPSTSPGRLPQGPPSSPEVSTALPIPGSKEMEQGGHSGCRI